MICECVTYYLKVAQETGKELFFIKRPLYLTWKIGLFKLVRFNLWGIEIGWFKSLIVTVRNGRKCFTINLC